MPADGKTHEVQGTPCYHTFMMLRNPHQNIVIRVLIAAALMLPWTAGASDTQAATDEKPNIIFILADDLGYGDLGSYGQQRIRTPHLDKMAAQGMRFTQAYAGSTVCAPSRCVLMTGLHTGHAYIRGNGRLPLRPEDQTVAQVLKDAGYQTALIGKWGLGDAGTTGHPNQKGFDYFFGYLDQGHAHNYYPTHLWRDEERVPLANSVPNEDAHGAGVANVKSQYSHDLIAQEALDYIDRAKDGPFFLYLAFTIPHANNEARNRGMEVPDYGPYAAERWPDPQKGLAAMITRMDGDIGRLFEKLREHGLDEKTIVFFSSDNGPHAEGGNDPKFFNSSGPLRGLKRDLYEGGIRVPMIVRRPGHIEPGAINHTPWAFWDFLPTAAELAGAESPQGLDGVSIVPALRGQAMDDERLFFWEFFERGSSVAVRRGKWKAVRKNYIGAKTELYDLMEDIGEKRDLARQFPHIVRELEHAMIQSHTDSEHFRFPRQRLEDLLRE